jgi:NAD(P)-dependent dehydrogenase (short-subunit alcohol dehydrogenase family)
MTSQVIAARHAEPESSSRQRHTTGEVKVEAVLITGCSSGIGLETALAFARRGSATYATMRDPAKATVLRERAAAEGLAVEVLALDVTDDASVAAAVAEVERRHGAVDVAVNNAGVGASGPLETVGMDRARNVFETNLWGPIRVARAVLPAMRARGRGVIVNVSSLAARVPAVAYNGLYAASKHALGAVSESLAWEAGPFGIRVVCVEPGFVATEISARNWGALDEADPYAPDHAWMAGFFRASEAAGSHPASVADAIVRAAGDPSTPLHTVIGDDAAAYVRAAAQAGSHEAWMAAAAGIVASVAGPRPPVPAPAGKGSAA